MKFAKPVIFVFSALTIAAVSNGCSAVSGVCCTDFKLGTDMSAVDFGVSGNIKGQFGAFAQASGDLIATVGSINSDITNACKGIAVDLGADPTEPDAAKLGAKQPVEYWCSQAMTQIASFKGNATLTLVFDPPQCSVDVQASAKCNARCDVSGMCDVNATLLKCMGGMFEVSCSGVCDVQSLGVAFDCEGSCSGQCSGSCEVTGGGNVMCNGKCEGTCMGGTDNQGNCMGNCNGTCTYAAMAKASCSGTCRGQCDAKCTVVVMGGLVKCSGKCDAKAMLFECKGGKLEVMCNVDANCKANCDASVQVKVECKLFVIKVIFNGNVDVKFA